MIDEDIPLGPVDYVVIEFPRANFTGEGIPVLLELVDRGIIRILDAAVVKANDDGTFVGLTMEDLDEFGGHFEAFKGVSSGMLDQYDFDSVGAITTPGSAAAIIVYENTWAGPFATAMRKAGGQLVSFGRIGVEELAAALELTDEDIAAASA